MLCLVSLCGEERLDAFGDLGGAVFLDVVLRVETERVRQLEDQGLIRKKGCARLQ